MIETTHPIFIMFGTKPPQEITNIIMFSENNIEEANKTSYYSNIEQIIKACMEKYQKLNNKSIKYKVCEKVLLKK